MHSTTNSLQPLKVVLGTQTMKAFVAAPKEFKVLGIVRMGMEFGLLATTPSGKYVRVNGSRVFRLDTQAIEAAMQAAVSDGRGESYAASRERQPTNETTVVPAVVQRKRRRYVQLPEFNSAAAVNTSMGVDVA
jgi:hypothetical protein